MENYTKTMTAWTPSFGMPAAGHRCATDVRLLGAAAALQGTAVSIERVKGVFPGPPAWSRST
jgi:hypothetical protein